MAHPKTEYIYGINPAFEVVRAGKRPVHEVFLNKASSRHPRIRKLSEYLGRMDINVTWTDKDRLFKLAGTKDHQGAVVKTVPYPYIPSDSLWDRPRLLLLDNVEDPHNVGAILRSAEIFGFSSVLLSKRGVPDVYPSIVKVSAGATEFLDIAKDSSANNYVKAARDEDYQIVALDMSGTSDIRSVGSELSGNVLVVIGGEDKSVGQYILNEADHIVSIPQQGKINSLNASVAAGISLFALSTEPSK
jgi:23S rRNA (guanosine2251-2'-O)-methyltransferase